MGSSSTRFGVKVNNIWVATTQKLILRDVWPSPPAAPSQQVTFFVLAGGLTQQVLGQISNQPSPVGVSSSKWRKRHFFNRKNHEHKTHRIPWDWYWYIYLKKIKMHINQIVVNIIPYMEGCVQNMPFHHTAYRLSKHNISNSFLTFNACLHSTCIFTRLRQPWLSGKAQLATLSNI